MASGGVDENLYNYLYENETALGYNDSFFESPVRIADCYNTENVTALEYNGLTGDGSSRWVSPAYCDTDSEAKALAETALDLSSYIEKYNYSSGYYTTMGCASSSGVCNNAYRSFATYAGYYYPALSLK